jgi:4-alpha-glucanotransferase
MISVYYSRPAADSGDVWANPEFFLLDDHRQPRFVAGGVPCPTISARKGNCEDLVYDWEALRRTRYRSWIDRLKALLADEISAGSYGAGLGCWRETHPGERDRNGLSQAADGGSSTL